MRFRQYKIRSKAIAIKEPYENGFQFDTKLAKKLIASVAWCVNKCDWKYLDCSGTI